MFLTLIIRSDMLMLSDIGCCGPNPDVVRAEHQVGQGVTKAGCKPLPSPEKDYKYIFNTFFDGNKKRGMILDELLSQSISETATERSRIRADLSGAHHHASRNQR